MHRQQAKSNLQIYSNDEDPRIKSKCSTPKKINSHQNIHANLNRSRQYESQTKDKDNKDKQYSYNKYERGEERTLNKNKNYRVQDVEISERVQFERNIEGKIQGYAVVAGTLREYIREQNTKGIKKKKHLGTVVQIIKAYTRSQITQLSPGVTNLITKMLDTLPIQHSTNNPKLKKQGSKSKNNHSIHVRQFSFSKKTFERQAKPLRTQIRQLEQDLHDYRQKGELLEQMRSQFQEMSEADKQNYISQLEEIVRKQRNILETLGVGSDDQNQRK